MINPTVTIGNWQIYLGNPWIMVTTAILLISLLFTLRACWRRLFGRKPALAILVAVINVLAFGALLLLLTEPRREHLARQNVLLVTEGAQLDGNIQFKNDKVYVAPGAASSKEDQKRLKHANWLLDIGQLNIREPALAEVTLAGYGLDEDQWMSIAPDVRVNYQAMKPSGFTEMQWPRNLVSGESLAVTGRYRQVDGKSLIQLRLLDPAGTIVSESRIKDGDRFRLDARPKGPGNLAYQLQAWQGDALHTEQTVNVGVDSATPVNIMVEQSSPSFETMQLKNYAATHGAGVLINTQISKGKSISQSANLPDNAETELSPKTLDSQDVLIIDGRALVNLAGARRQWLLDAVDRGLGLLILADESLLKENDKFKTGLLDGFELVANNASVNKSVPQLLNGSANSSDLPLAITAMDVQATRVGMEILVSDAQGRILVANRSHGLGNVAISLVTQSHALLTSGNRSFWSDYWSAIFKSISRQRTDSYLIPQAATAFYSADERTPVCAFSNNEDLVLSVKALDPADIESNNGQEFFELALTPDSLGSARQCAWFWPQSCGWYQVQLRSGVSGILLDQQAIHIPGSEQWQAQKRHERVTATDERLARTRPRITVPENTSLISEPVNNFWLWILLVVSASLLWLERKMDFAW